MATTTTVLSLNGKPQVTPPRGTEGQQQQNASAVGVATQKVMQVLGALARIQISDGRIIVGRLHCFDKHQNVILTDAREYAPISDAKDKSKGAVRKQSEDQAPQNEDDDAAFETHRRATTSRHLGMTLVPGKHIVYIKVQA
uniref:Sm domain-containing protein n=1 Tax=Globisporangium ultimum (strain ATCC 200006 / CBS 805.95 / DAOM BR144) TaxID=431595 RepID=K3WY80_GLOUD